MHMRDGEAWNGVRQLAFEENAWFEPKNTEQALSTWAGQLTSDALTRWLNSIPHTQNPKNIGIVMAGNIPMVGLHDLLSVLAVGHRAFVKLSADDTVLMKAVISFLHDQGLSDRIVIADRIKDVDAVIATGSNNSSRYFEYYFKDIPRVIRKNRSSVAVVHSTDEPSLELIRKDIFDFFGKGCMNVSKVYLKAGSDIVSFIDHLEGAEDVMNYHRYHSNYTYHKALFLMNKEQHLDNGFILIKQDQGIHAPLGCLFFDFFKDDTTLYQELEAQKDEIQLIVNGKEASETTIPQVRFGETQNNQLDRYADNVDIPSFLGSIE
jgi:hypothetical protein